MPLVKLELHRASGGPVPGGEDRWRLVFDTAAKRLYVEHEWERADDARRDGAAERRRPETDVEAFLTQPVQGMAHRALLRLLSGLVGHRFVA